MYVNFIYVNLWNISLLGFKVQMHKYKKEWAWNSKMVMKFVNKVHKWNESWLCQIFSSIFQKSLLITNTNPFYFLESSRDNAIEKWIIFQETQLNGFVYTCFKISLIHYYVEWLYFYTTKTILPGIIISYIIKPLSCWMMWNYVTNVVEMSPKIIQMIVYEVDCWRFSLSLSVFTAIVLDQTKSWMLIPLVQSFIILFIEFCLLIKHFYFLKMAWILNYCW